jgi:hypothetical protein
MIDFGAAVTGDLENYGEICTPIYMDRDIENAKNTADKCAMYEAY